MQAARGHDHPVGFSQGDCVEATKAARTVRGYVSGYTKTSTTKQVAVVDRYPMASPGATCGLESLSLAAVDTAVGQGHAVRTLLTLTITAFLPPSGIFNHHWSYGSVEESCRMFIEFIQTSLNFRDLDDTTAPTFGPRVYSRNVHHTRPQRRYHGCLSAFPHATIDWLKTWLPELFSPCSGQRANLPIRPAMEHQSFRHAPRRPKGTGIPTSNLLLGANHSAHDGRRKKREQSPIRDTLIACVKEYISAFDIGVEACLEKAFLLFHKLWQTVEWIGMHQSRPLTSNETRAALAGPGQEGSNWPSCKRSTLSASPVAYGGPPSTLLHGAGSQASIG